MWYKRFNNNLTVIRKNKVVLKLSKPAHIRMYILKLSKVLTDELPQYKIKHRYDNR